MRAPERRANRAARKRIRARARAWLLAIYATDDTQLDPWQLSMLVDYLAGPDPRTERANLNRMIDYLTAPLRADERRAAQIPFTVYDGHRGTTS